MKCARSWSRVPEQDFLADEWKAKHARKEPAKQETPSAAPTGPSGDVNGNQPPPASPLATEDKTVASILVNQELGGAKRGKQVTFAKVIDDSGNPPSEDGAVQKSKMVKRSRVVRRSSGASRPRTVAVGAVATGVVATGGTFDFLSKIKATKREPPTNVKTKKVEEAKKAPAHPASPPKVE